MQGGMRPTAVVHDAAPGLYLDDGSMLLGVRIDLEGLGGSAPSPEKNGHVHLLCTRRSRFDRVVQLSKRRCHGSQNLVAAQLGQFRSNDRLHRIEDGYDFPKVCRKRLSSRIELPVAHDGHAIDFEMHANKREAGALLPATSSRRHPDWFHARRRARPWAAPLPPP